MFVRWHIEQKTTRNPKKVPKTQDKKLIMFNVLPIFIEVLDFFSLVLDLGGILYLLTLLFFGLALIFQFSLSINDHKHDLSHHFYVHVITP